MTDELLFNITDTQIQEAGRWQRRALKAEAEVAELGDSVRLNSALRNEAVQKNLKLQALLKPRRIDDDTPDGVLVWVDASYQEGYRTDTGRWVQSSTNLYHDTQPTWWLPMPPAPEEDS